MMAVKPIPDGYHSITPYLVVSGAARAIEFYKQIFAAKIMFRMDGPDGKVGHAELRIGDSAIMLADEFPAMGSRSAQSIGGSPVSLMLYVEDVQSVFDKAVAGGATVIRPVCDQFYGDRSGMVTDPFGHIWTISTHIEDVSHEEMLRRAAAFKPPS